MKKRTKKYPAPGRENDPTLKESALAADLDFPVAPEFVSLPPQIELEIMLRRIAETMPWRSTRPGEEQRRLAEKIPVEFVL